jgi:hypothetical protein
MTKMGCAYDEPSGELEELNTRWTGGRSCPREREVESATPEGKHTWYRRVFCCIDRRVIFCAFQNGVLLPVDPHTVDTIVQCLVDSGVGPSMSSNLGAKTGLYPCTDQLCVEITQSFSNLLKFLASPSAESPCHGVRDPSSSSRVKLLVHAALSY